MRVGPIGPSPYVILRSFGPAATAFRSAPAQKVPFAPHSTATRVALSRSNARNASASAFRVGRSIAFRRSGRSRMMVVTAPCVSDLTLGRSIVGALPELYVARCYVATCVVDDTVARAPHNNLTRRRAVGYQGLSLRCS